MNPYLTVEGTMAMHRISAEREREATARDARQAVLHTRAVARRRKAKRGGKR